MAFKICNDLKGTNCSVRVWVTRAILSKNVTLPEMTFIISVFYLSSCFSLPYINHIKNIYQMLGIISSIYFLKGWYIRVFCRWYNYSLQYLVNKVSLWLIINDLNSRFVVQGGRVGPPFCRDATEFWPFRASFGIQVCALRASAALSLRPVGRFLGSRRGKSCAFTRRTQERGDACKKLADQ